MTTVRLGPVAQVRAGRLARRLPQLYLGLVLYGVSIAMMVTAGLGNAPWDVLHQGMARHLPISIGTALMVTSVVVLVLWIPLREMPGLGTISNTLVIGPVADLGLSLISQPPALWERGLLMVAGIGLNALATGLYLGSGFGAGPRDGLMTGLHRRTGLSVRLVRTCLEVTVVVLGWLLGGTVGLGTVCYALAIGTLSQPLIRRFTVDVSGGRAASAASASRRGDRPTTVAPCDD